MRAKAANSTLGSEAAPVYVAGATGLPVYAATPHVEVELVAVAGETGLTDDVVQVYVLVTATGVELELE